MLVVETVAKIRRAYFVQSTAICPDPLAEDAAEFQFAGTPSLRPASRRCLASATTKNRHACAQQLAEPSNQVRGTGTIHPTPH
jgi:hypothetical protein